jgi:hypothetical protein
MKAILFLFISWFFWRLHTTITTEQRKPNFNFKEYGAKSPEQICFADGVFFALSFVFFVGFCAWLF